MGNAMPCLNCQRCKKINDDLAAKLLEAPRHGEHWAAKQRHNSNKAQRLHDELNHVDIEPLEDQYWQLKAQLYWNHQDLQWIIYRGFQDFISPKNILVAFIFIKKIKKCFIFYILFQI